MRLTRLRVGEYYYSPETGQHFKYKVHTLTTGYLFFNLHTLETVRLEYRQIFQLENTLLDIRQTQEKFGVSL